MDGRQLVNLIKDKWLQVHLVRLKVRLHPDVENEHKCSFSEGGGVD